MQHLTVVSFDADAIRIVTAQQSRDRLVFKRALTLADDELEGFLSLDRSNSYLITVNPPDALYETITIPPVGAKLIDRIIATELRRLHPEMPSFSTAYQVVGDSVQDGRTIRRVACCLIPDEFLNSLLEPFIRHSKPVRMIASTPYCLARLVAKTPSGLPDTLLCAYDEGERKTLLVHENGAVLFTRQVPSEGRGWNSFDRQNITMTLDYCFQTLRIRPGGAIVINGEDPPPPFVDFIPAIPAGIPTETMQEYPSQIALLAHPLALSEDLRPDSYRASLREQDLINHTSTAFSIAAAIVLVLLVLQSFLITTMHSTLNSLRQQPALLRSTLSAHQQALEKRAAIEPLITILNNQQAEPSIPALMTHINLSRSHENLKLTSFAVKHDKEGIQISLIGRIAEPALADAETRLENLAKNLAATKGITVNTRTMDPKATTFTMEATHKP